LPNPPKRIGGDDGGSGILAALSTGGKASMTQIEEWREIVRQFIRDRDWDKHHNPKNMAIVLTVEAAEVLEHFQWLPDGQSADLTPAKRREVAHELADVMQSVVRLADLLEIDLDAAFREKMVLNCAKYPPEKVQGRAIKYTEL
jgi:dCTP diphosphatase